jgi:outer membrane immunogenic protein
LYFAEAAMILRQMLLLSAAALMLSTPSFAADLAPAPVEPVAPVTTFSWTGFYAGVHAGYGWGRENDNLSVPTAGAVGLDHFDVNGAVGGVHAGYNEQFNSFVVGLEGDVDLSGIRGSTHSAIGAEGATISSLSLRNTWQGSVRARIGYAFDRFLFYGTGGVAFGDAKVSGSVIGPAGIFSGSDTKTLVGWTVGLGGEYAFDDHWIARAEVRYTDFGKSSYRLGGADGTLPFKAGFDEVTTLLGVSYKF